MKFLLPRGWARPHGYAAGVAASGTLVFVSGQIGWDESQRFVAFDFPGQVLQALRNVAAVLAEAGASPEHVTRMTWYVTDKREYVADRVAVGAAYRSVFGKHFPAMSVVEVAGLVEDAAKIEIEATAVIPPSPREGL